MTAKICEATSSLYARVVHSINAQSATILRTSPARTLPMLKIVGSKASILRFKRVLHIADEMRHGSHRVAPQVGQRAVRGFALDGNIQAADHGHFRSFANADAPHWELRASHACHRFLRTGRFSKAPASIILRAPPWLSSAGWNTSTTSRRERRTARVHRAGRARAAWPCGRRARRRAFGPDGWRQTLNRCFPQFPTRPYRRGRRSRPFRPLAREKRISSHLRLRGFRRDATGTLRPEYRRAFSANHSRFRGCGAMRGDPPRWMPRVSMVLPSCAVGNAARSRGTAFQ